MCDTASAEVDCARLRASLLLLALLLLLANVLFHGKTLQKNALPRLNVRARALPQPLRRADVCGGEAYKLHGEAFSSFATPSQDGAGPTTAL